MVAADLAWFPLSRDAKDDWKAVDAPERDNATADAIKNPALENERFRPIVEEIASGDELMFCCYTDVSWARRLWILRVGSCRGEMTD